MRVLLSIKPEFVTKIFEGSKRFEFRKSLFKHPDVKTVIVYASSPVQKVVGEFEIEMIHEDEPSKLWRKTKQHSGISSDFYFSYFENRDIAYAIEIKSTKRYRQPYDLQKRHAKKPPQSFLYL